jgi:hypothetical protein
VPAPLDAAPPLEVLPPLLLPSPLLPPPELLAAAPLEAPALELPPVEAALPPPPLLELLPVELPGADPPVPAVPWCHEPVGKSVPSPPHAAAAMRTTRGSTLRRAVRMSRSSCKARSS